MVKVHQVSLVLILVVVHDLALKTKQTTTIYIRTTLKLNKKKLKFLGKIQRIKINLLVENSNLVNVLQQKITSITAAQEEYNVTFRKPSTKSESLLKSYTVST